VLPPNDHVTFVSFCPVLRAMETPNMASLKANEYCWLCPAVNPESRLTYAKEDQGMVSSNLKCINLPGEGLITFTIEDEAASCRPMSGLDRDIITSRAGTTLAHHKSAYFQKSNVRSGY